MSISRVPAVTLIVLTRRLTGRNKASYRSLFRSYLSGLILGMAQTPGGDLQMTGTRAHMPAIGQLLLKALLHLAL